MEIFITIVVAVVLLGWAFLAIRSMRKKGNPCSGCTRCCGCQNCELNKKDRL